MDMKEHLALLLQELMDGIDKGDLTKEIIPDKYTWEHLMPLLAFKESLDGAEVLFSQLYDLAIQSGERYLRNKAKRGEKIQIAFQSYSAAQWPAEAVYHTFEKAPNVKVKVIVSPLADRNQESILDTFNKSVSWFRDNGYNVIEGLNPNTMQPVDWNGLGGYPDVLYQVSSWYSSLFPCQWFCKLPLRCLVAYIPYGMSMMDNQDGSYAVRMRYNKDFMNLMWRVYCDTAFSKAQYNKHQMLGGKNVRFSGYAKMDYLYQKEEFSDEKLRQLWKIPEDKDPHEMKKVIIAPHFSVGNEWVLLLSTFSKNVWFWRYLAEKYKDSVTFLFKPHPNLRHAAVKNKVFGSFEEYDDYIAGWDALPNAKAVQEGSYLEHFKTSDAMIMDSGSFLGEYLYTGNPLLYLTRPEQRFMEIGQKILDSYYKTPGENYSEIERFLQEVVIEGNDPMKDRREQVFREELDYMSANGIPASQFICREVFDLIDG